MSKKSIAKHREKTAAQATVTATHEQAELSYDEMLTELEAIVIEADVRLAEEEGTL